MIEISRYPFRDRYKLTRSGGNGAWREGQRSEKVEVERGYIRIGGCGVRDFEGLVEVEPCGCPGNGK